MPIYILEVLKNEYVINLNTIDDFVNTVPGGYWGEKFGVKSYSSLKIDDLELIFEAFIDLFKLETGIPLKYNWNWRVSTGEITTTYKYIKGKFKTQYYQQPIGFRCDTFVRYLFEAGPGVKFDTGLFISPRLLYKSLLHLRNGQEIPFSILPIPYNLPLSSDLEKEIKEALVNDNSDRVDALTFAYISESTIENDTKAKCILSLANLYIEDEYRSSYLLDLLFELKLFGISSELINTYFNATNIEVRSKLYSLIENSILFGTKAETKELSSADIEKIIYIEDFLLKQANTITTHETINKRYINQLKHLLLQSNNTYKHKKTVKKSLSGYWW